MAAQIKFTIRKNGEVVSEGGQNCTGDLCRSLTSPIEQALGQIQTTADKPEAFVVLETQDVSQTEK